MSMFHTHFFKESLKDPEIIFCHCGETRDLHRHIWEAYENISSAGIKIGKVLRCKICGDLKEFSV